MQEISSVPAEKLIEKADFKTVPLPGEEFDGYVFRSCDFSGSDLSGRAFWDCRFEGCNLSLANFGNSALRDVVFSDCKMLGVRFDRCNKMGLAFSFERCNLDHSSFFGLKVPRTRLSECMLREVDFSEADFAGSDFDKCDLDRAVFMHTNLQKADFRSATGYALDPESNRIGGAKFSSQGLQGLLVKYKIEIFP